MAFGVLPRTPKTPRIRNFETECRPLINNKKHAFRVLVLGSLKGTLKGSLLYRLCLSC